MIKEIMLASALAFTNTPKDINYDYLNLYTDIYEIGRVDIYEFFNDSVYAGDNYNCILIRPFDNFAIGLASYNADSKVIESYENYYYEADFPIGDILKNKEDDSLSDFQFLFEFASHTFMIKDFEGDRIHMSYLVFDEGDNLLYIDSESYDLTYLYGNETYFYSQMDNALNYNIDINNNVLGDFSIAIMFTNDNFDENDDGQWVNYIWQNVIFESMHFYTSINNGLTAKSTINGVSNRINLLDDYLFTLEDLEDLNNQYNTEIDDLNTKYNNLLNQYNNIKDNYDAIVLENEQLNSKHVLTNVFDIVRGALDGVVNFFNIELMPNLTIGTIIFIPVVVGVIFFILKALVL